MLLSASPRAGRYDIVQAVNAVLQYGADPTGATDSSAAINAALATGSPVFLGEGTFRVDSGVMMGSNKIGQRFFGAGMEKTVLLPAAGVAGITFRGRSQLIQDLTIDGTDREIAGHGVDIPQYLPYWTVQKVLIRNVENAINNKVVSPAPGDPQGSDAGLILNSQIAYASIGYYAFGNQDETPIIGTSIGSCSDAGLKAEGGGIAMYGGVLGGNGTSAKVLTASGISLHDVHIEADPGQLGYSGYNFTLAGDSTLALYSCFAQNGSSGVVDFHCTANGAVCHVYGPSGFASATTVGTGAVIDHGNNGSIVIDYGGTGITLKAGNYRYGDFLPTASAFYDGQYWLLVSGYPYLLYFCQRTGASTYEWKQISFA